MESGESVYLATQGKNKYQANKGKEKMPIQGGIKKESSCYFCKKKGHMKKDYLKFKAWLEKKGNLFSLVYYESNMVEIDHNNGGLILVLQSMSQIPCRVCKT